MLMLRHSNHMTPCLVTRVVVEAGNVRGVDLTCPSPWFMGQSWQTSARRLGSELALTTVYVLSMDPSIIAITLIFTVE